MDEQAIVYVDGAARGNPGPAGIGIVIKIDGRVERYSEYVGRLTNNAAEYLALISALEKVRSKNIQKVKVITDSQLLARQLKGEYKVRSRLLSELYKNVVKLVSELQQFEIIHVSREDNMEADRLANEAINRARR